MTFFGLLTSLGVAGPLASRAFLPLFIVSLCTAFPEWMAKTPLGAISPPPGMEWLSSWWFVGIAGALAAAEILADKNVELREFLDEAMVYVKTGVAVLIGMSLLPPETRLLVNEAQASLPAGVQTAGWTGSLLLGAAAGALTWRLATWRRALWQTWSDIDDDDVLMVRQFMSSFEDFFALIGIVLLVLLPILTILLTGVLLLAVFVVRRWLARQEEKQRQPCAGCEHPLHPLAPSCYSCGAVQPLPSRLTWHVFGRAKAVANTGANEGNLPVLAAAAAVGSDGSALAQDERQRRAHALRLVSLRRCPYCAEKGTVKELLSKPCGHCGRSVDEVLGDGWYDEYHRAVMARAWGLSGPILALSCIPVIGFAIAIVWLKLSVVQPFRIFLPGRHRFFLRWGLRLLALALLLPASLPVLSLLSVPVLYLAHLWGYGSLARHRVQRTTDSAALMRPEPTP